MSNAADITNIFGELAFKVGRSIDGTHFGNTPACREAAGALRAWLDDEPIPEISAEAVEAARDYVREQRHL